MEIKTIQIDSDTFLVFKGTQYIQINVEDIVSIKADNKYATICTKNCKKFTICCSSIDITKHLCLEFIIVTKGFLINKKYILELTKRVEDKSVYKLVLNDSDCTTITVSRYAAGKILEQL